jgi:glycosyltransferase involved in cell wall biosynthesis
MAPELEAAGATIHVLPMRRITTSGSAWYWLAYLAAWPVTVFRLFRLARRVDAAVVHTNSLHSWYGWAVAALLRRPHVWHAREIVVQSRAAMRFERFACRHFATRVIAVSAAVAGQLDAGNVVVEYDEADPDEFCPKRAGAFRARIGVADDVALIGAAGRIDTWKGFEVLLDAVPAMQAARPGLEVVIAGAPVRGKEDYAARLASRSAAMPGVHWLGPRDDIAEMIADLDVLVLASTEPEPFGLVVVEALASGVPVVATAAGGPLEILSECSDRVGRLVEPADAAALATAAVQLLPAGPSGAAQRRRRPVLRTPVAGAMAKMFDELIGG